MQKEVIGNCTLYYGDSRDVIATLSGIDAVVTDPPYGIEDIVGGYGRGGKHTIKNDKNLDVCHAVLNACAEHLNDFRLMAFYSCKVVREFYAGIENMDFYGDMVWDKMVPGLGAAFRYQHENIAIFTKGQPPKIGDGFSILRFIRNPDLHPHQKPIGLMTRLIEISGGTHILDPFMGSGSTGVACAKMGKTFTGIELEEKYFEIACKRIEEAYRQPDMFVEQPKYVQESLI